MSLYLKHVKPDVSPLVLVYWSTLMLYRVVYIYFRFLWFLLVHKCDAVILVFEDKFVVDLKKMLQSRSKEFSKGGDI
jgi:hypothetical protein